MKPKYLLIFFGLVIFFSIALSAFYQFIEQQNENQVLIPEDGAQPQQTERTRTRDSSDDAERSTESAVELKQADSAGSNRDDDLNQSVEAREAVSRLIQRTFSEAKGLPEEIGPLVDEWAEKTYTASPSDLAYYTSLTDVELERAAQSGDPIAQKELGTRLVRVRGDIKNGLDWLIEAASYGSPDASNELAALYLVPPDGMPEDRLASLAWSQVSFTFGDWTALNGIGYTLQSSLSNNERMLVDAYSAFLLQDLNNRNIERTGQELLIRIRPDFQLVFE